MHKIRRESKKTELAGPTAPSAGQINTLLHYVMLMSAHGCRHLSVTHEQSFI